MKRNTIKLGPVPIEELIEMIPESLKSTYKNLPYINLEKAKDRYRYKIN